MRDRVKETLRSSIKIKGDCLGRVEEPTAEVARLMMDAVATGGKVLVCGNGGSAADAQHMTGEMVVRYAKARRALPFIALTNDSSIVTAQANDVDFSTVFSRQVEALGEPGDVLFAISTSGDSPDVLEAAKVARRRGLKVTGLTGRGGGGLTWLCDVAIVVPAEETPRIQEVHITLIHAICELVEDHFS